MCIRDSRKDYGGERGIRTLGTVSRTHAFQACSLSHSDISPPESGRRPPGREESLHQRTALLFFDATDDRDALHQPGLVRNIEDTLAGAGARLARAEHDARQPGQDYRADAHHTRLDGAVEHGLFERVHPGRLCGFPQCTHFSVLKRLAGSFRLIAVSYTHLTLPTSDL